MQKQRRKPPVSVERLTSSGSAIVALLASQHHALHLLLLFGLGGAGMSVMNTSPTLRRAMLAVALAMATVTAYRLVQHHTPPYQRAVSLLSLILTLGLLAWSIMQFGL